MALSVGVELSYLIDEHQRAVAEASEYYDCTPSYAQAVRLRKESDEKYCILTPDRIFKILGEEKANQREKVSFQVGDLFVLALLELLSFVLALTVLLLLLHR